MGGGQCPHLLSHFLVLPFYLLNENMWLNSQMFNACKIQVYRLTNRILVVSSPGGNPSNREVFLRLTWALERLGEPGLLTGTPDTLPGG